MASNHAGSAKLITLRRRDRFAVTLVVRRVLIFYIMRFYIMSSYFASCVHLRIMSSQLCVVPQKVKVVSIMGMLLTGISILLWAYLR